MKGVFVFISSVAFCSAISVRQQLRPQLRNEFNSSKIYPDSLTQDHYFQQKLDHFNPNDDQKWDQRYWVNPTYYKKNGPAFLFLNGESSANINWNTSHVDYRISYAKELNAYCFSLEHRFYGKSWPANGNMFRHLSSEQALADVAQFIKNATEEYKLPQNTKWIVFGCSYAGSLAAWARLKYPYLVHGAVASSAPLLVKIDYEEYYQVVEESLKLYDPKCLEGITNATRELASLIKNSNDVKNGLQLFDSCGDQLKDIAAKGKTLFSDVVQIISVAVQYNDSSSINIPTVCNIMIHHSGTKLEAFANIGKKFKQYNNFENKPWDYQSCTEFGYFSSFKKTLSLSAGNDLLPIETDIKDTCEQFFGPNFGIDDINEKIDHTNMVYGGLNFNVGNTVFIHGSLDPWHKAGLYNRASGSLYQTILINGTSHCADIFPASDRDSQDLKNARQKILEILKVWLR